MISESQQRTRANIYFAESWIRARRSEKAVRRVCDDGPSAEQPKGGALGLLAQLGNGSKKAEPWKTARMRVETKRRDYGCMYGTHGSV